MQTDSPFESKVAPAIISLQLFAAQSGLSPITMWRFRKRGWLQTTNIAGRQYLTGEQIAEFKRRAASGEFSKNHPTPKRASQHQEVA